MWKRLSLILEMIRFSHTIFALPFALLSAVWCWTTTSRGGATTPFRWWDLLGILVCMVAARSAAMAFNRLVDRHVDARNPRTANRHLPSGALSVSAVVLFTLAMSAFFIASTLLFLPNRLPIFLSLPVLGFLLGYSYAKRFTALAHFWLGAALSLAPVSVWIALRGGILWHEPADILPPCLLGLAILLWVAGFDMIYACQDAQFDATARLHSIPARLGIAKSLRLAAFCHLLMIGALAAIPFTGNLGGPFVPAGRLFGLGVLCVAALLAYEHSLVRPDDLTRVNIAFFHVNAVVSLGLFLLGAIDSIW